MKTAFICISVILIITVGTLLEADAKRLTVIGQSPASGDPIGDRFVSAMGNPVIVVNTKIPAVYGHQVDGNTVRNAQRFPVEGKNAVDTNWTSAGIRPVAVVAMPVNEPGANPGLQARPYEILAAQEAPQKVTLQDIKRAITSRNHSALKEMIKHFNVNTGDTRLKNRYAAKDVNNPLALAILVADPESVLILLEAGADTRQRVYHTVSTNGKEETREGTLYELALGLYETYKNAQLGSFYTTIVNDMTRYHIFTEAEQKKIDQYTARQRAEEEREIQESEARLSAKYSPFYAAIKAGDLGTVKQFIENKKIDINFAEFESGYSTPLITAVLANKIEIVEYLLTKNADISIYTSDGDDALNCASGRGYLDIVRLLVAHGADINENVDTEGRGPLVNAIGSGKVDVVKFLLSKGADLNAAQERAGSLLYFGVQSKNLAMVRFLVDTGLDVNVKHKYGKTPLDLAVQYNYQVIVRFLKAKGAKQSSELPAR